MIDAWVKEIALERISEEVNNLSVEGIKSGVSYVDETIEDSGFFGVDVDGTGLFGKMVSVSWHIVIDFVED